MKQLSRTTLLNIENRIRTAAQAQAAAMMVYEARVLIGMPHEEAAYPLEMALWKRCDELKKTSAQKQRKAKRR